MKKAYTEANQQYWTNEELENYLITSIKEKGEIGRIKFAIKKVEKKIKNKRGD